MIATIHQLNYLPWLGFFSKIKNSDLYIMFDIVDYVKNAVMNRNKIRTSEGWTYLTIPIERKWYRKPFHEVLLPSDESWREAHWKTILFNYKNSDYFETYHDFFEKLYTRKKHKTLMELNLEIILYLFRQFGIEVKTVKTRELDINTNLNKTDILVEILRAVNADTYLSGEGARDYMEMDKFRKAGIEVKFHKYIHPEYKQRFEGFVPNMAAIDALFNTGEKARGLL